MKNQEQIKFFSQYAPVLNIGDWTYIHNSFGHNRIHYILDLPTIDKNEHKGRPVFYICVTSSSFRYGVKVDMINPLGSHSMEDEWLSDWDLLL
jgi:hypothetical protein